MGSFIELNGKKFGRLTVIRHCGNRGIQPLFLCQCDCGKMCEVRGDKLRSGKTTSCGCVQREYRDNKNGVRGNKYEIGGEVYTTKQILEISHLSQATFYRRLQEGYTVEELVRRGRGR